MPKLPLWRSLQQQPCFLFGHMCSQHLRQPMASKQARLEISLSPAMFLALQKSSYYMCSTPTSTFAGRQSPLMRCQGHPCYHGCCG